MREKIARFPVVVHRYGKNKYLTLDSIDQILSLFQGESYFRGKRDALVIINAAIQQAKAEVTREMEGLLDAKDNYYQLRIKQIFEEIEDEFGKLFGDKRFEYVLATVHWEKLKSKYMEGK